TPPCLLHDALPIFSPDVVPEDSVYLPSILPQSPDVEGGLEVIKAILFRGEGIMGFMLYYPVPPLTVPCDSIHDSPKSRLSFHKGDNGVYPLLHQEVLKGVVFVVAEVPGHNFPDLVVEVTVLSPEVGKFVELAFKLLKLLLPVPSSYVDLDQVVDDGTAIELDLLNPTLYLLNVPVVVFLLALPVGFELREGNH